ncbi:response regulator transcription factor [Fictibacillus macauensis]|uniref:response regulator transcription factor n=1 Tax=Fictibacillus macauensis TaxID=245160 RepID=UPI000683146E|nr:response regulator transcription factor [Fictibacillus macauensis]
MLTLLLVDDHAVVRQGLTMLLNAEPSFSVIGEAANGDEAIAQAAALCPDVIVMDVSMPGRDGLSASAEIHASQPNVAILVLTMHNDEGYIYQARQAGAAGCILKSAPHEALIEAIHQISRGEPYWPTSRRKPQVEEDHPLSQREKEVLTLIAKGYSNKEIAHVLVISVKTVETHKGHVMEKLGIKARHELVDYALKKGFLGYGQSSAISDDSSE